MSSHRASCHCGAVQYTFEGDIDKPVVCNCSMCGRSGAMMAFVPESSFTWVSGEDQLVDYQFGHKHVHHPFCRTCGHRAVAWGTNAEGNKTMMVNLRCVEGYDIQAVSPTWYDGASL